MTIFYFTSTGNCLAIAKRIGGTLISIPQVVDQPEPYYKDDVIGLVFPIYALGLPKMVQQFIEKAKWEAEYTFAIGTYGSTDGATMMNLQSLVEKNGNRFDYAASLLMVDNYLPNFETGKQISKLPKKRVDENFSRILADIQSRKKLQATSSPALKVLTNVSQKFGWSLMSNPKFIVNKSCNQCSICTKVCPAGNITVADKVNFGNNCEVCLACIHLCPKNAIHMKSEKSNRRWINPEVTLKEIISANNTTAKKI